MKIKDVRWLYLSSEETSLLSFLFPTSSLFLMSSRFSSSLLFTSVFVTDYLSLVYLPPLSFTFTCAAVLQSLHITFHTLKIYINILTLKGGYIGPNPNYIPKATKYINSIINITGMITFVHI